MLTPFPLEYELRQKGLSDGIIREALAELDPQASAYHAAADQARRLRGLTREEFRSKLSAFLVRRGFGYDIVRDVVEQLLDELEKTQPDNLANYNTTDEE